MDDAPKINVPTLLLNGKYDRVTDNTVLPLFKAIPKVKWYTFVESSHTPVLEEREKYIKLVAAFLKD